MSWYSFDVHNGWLWLGLALLACAGIVGAFWSYVAADEHPTGSDGRTVWTLVAHLASAFSLIVAVFILGLLLVTAG